MGCVIRLAALERSYKSSYQGRNWSQSRADRKQEPRFPSVLPERCSLWGPVSICRLSSSAELHTASLVMDTQGVACGLPLSTLCVCAHAILGGQLQALQALVVTTQPKYCF